MFKQNVSTVPVHLVFENVVCLQNMFILIFKLLKLFIPVYFLNSITHLFSHITN